MLSALNKKLRLILAIVLPILALTIGLLIYNSPPKGFEYRKTVGGIAISRYVGENKDVVIPAKVQGRPVTMIDDFAFDGLGTTRASETCRKITSVAIPESVTVIGKYAFRNCDRLTTVIIPNRVTSIGDDAFSSCERLSSITIPSNVTQIGNNPFFGSERLQSITVEEGNSEFCSRDGVLYSKDMTVLLAYPIGKQDTSFTIPDGVTRIEKSSFSHCKTLTSIAIPDSVTSIGRQAFLYCANLSSVSLPDGLTSIENWTFEGCRGLSAIVIPKSVTQIGESAFRGTGLTSVSIPDGVTSIEEKTFISCNGLKTVTIPRSVRSIGDRAFKGCDNLGDVYFAGTFMEWYEIKIGIENDPLSGAHIHANSTEP